MGLNKFNFKFKFTCLLGKEAALGHKHDIPYPELRAARQVVPELECACALLWALGGDAGFLAN